MRLEELCGVGTTTCGDDLDLPYCVVRTTVLIPAPPNLAFRADLAT